MCKGLYERVEEHALVTQRCFLWWFCKSNTQKPKDLQGASDVCTHSYSDHQSGTSAELSAPQQIRVTIQPFGLAWVFSMSTFGRWFAPVTAFDRSVRGRNQHGGLYGIMFNLSLSNIFAMERCEHFRDSTHCSSLSSEASIDCKDTFDPATGSRAHTLSDSVRSCRFGAPYPCRSFHRPVMWQPQIDGGTSRVASGASRASASPEAYGQWRVPVRLRAIHMCALSTALRPLEPRDRRNNTETRT